MDLSPTTLVMDNVALSQTFSSPSWQCESKFDSLPLTPTVQLPLSPIEAADCAGPPVCHGRGDIVPTTPTIVVPRSPLSVFNSRPPGTPDLGSFSRTSGTWSLTPDGSHAEVVSVVHGDSDMSASPLSPSPALASPWTPSLNDSGNESYWHFDTSPMRSPTSMGLATSPRPNPPHEAASGDTSTKEIPASFGIEPNGTTAPNTPTLADMTMRPNPTVSASFTSPETLGDDFIDYEAWSNMAIVQEDYQHGSTSHEEAWHDMLASGCRATQVGDTVYVDRHAAERHHICVKRRRHDKAQ